MPPDPSDLKTKQVPLYHETLSQIEPATRHLLEKRGVPPDEVLSHVMAIRNKAWAIYPYPCIGMFSFTRLHLITHPLYTSSILPTLQRGGTLLDVGCGFASDFRALVDAGVDAAQLTGLDEHDGFWGLGMELYRDRGVMEGRFVRGDMTDLGSVPEGMRGGFDVVWAGASFHLFGWEGQIKAGGVVVRLLRGRRGSAVYGYQVGRTKGREVSSEGSEVLSGGKYLHDETTFKSMWEEVGRLAGMRFEVKTWMDDRGLEDLKKKDPEIRRLRFAVVRVDGPEHEDGKDLLEGGL